MWLDFYMFLTLASGIALAVLGWQLCSIHIPHREDTHRLRTARAILAASYFILAIPAFCELFNGGEADRKIIAVFTIAVAAYQSLLFTVTLLTSTAVCYPPQSTDTSRNRNGCSCHVSVYGLDK